MMISFGESGLPVFQAGHTLWHRPHSVHEYVSRISFHVRSSRVAAPREASPSVLSRSMCRGRSRPRALVLAKKTFGSDTKMCRCFEWGMYARKPRINRMCDHRNRCSYASFAPCPMCRKSGAKTLENGVQEPG